MGLSRRDFLAVLDCVHTLHECPDLPALQKRMIQVLPDLVPADTTALTEVDVERERGFSIVNPSSFDLSKLMPVFQAHLHEHPVIMQHSTPTAAQRPLAISDFLGRGEFRRLGIYNEVYRVMGVEDQISLSLRPGGSLLVGLSLSRKGWGFSRRDRDVLDLIRPHLIQAYQNVAVLSEIRTQIGDVEHLVERLPFGIVQLGKAGRVEHVSGVAEALIERFFTSEARPIRVLPDQLSRWIRAQTDNRQASLAPFHSLVIQRDGCALMVRLIHDGAGRSLILLSEQNAALRRDSILKRLGCTRREAQVMHWVIEGKTSPQIGIILGLSTRTVHKHLERVFQKLNVETRTAAITRVLDQSARFDLL